MNNPGLIPLRYAKFFGNVEPIDAQKSSMVLKRGIENNRAKLSTHSINRLNFKK